MSEQFYIIILAILAPIVYKLPILATKKFVTLFLATIMWLTFVLSSPSKVVMYEIWILISIFIFYILFVGYRITKQIESKIITYVNEQINILNTTIELSHVLFLVDVHLDELAVISDKKKFIQDTLEILNKKNIFSTPIVIS